MKNKSRFFKVLNKDGKERGASLVEYGLLLALIAVIAIPAVRVVGGNISMIFEDGELKDALASGSICLPGNPC